MDPSELKRDAVPGAVLDVLARLGEAGHAAYLVGGAVRDLLLGSGTREAADWDLATSARPEAVQALFEKVVPTGIDHGTVTVVVGDAAIEVTTFRGEGAYTDARRPDEVHFLDDIEADLARRDFTINALAWNPLDGRFSDPFGGLDDLEAGRVRAVGDPLERFAEDGLRPMRAVRFACVLEFSLDPSTEAAIPQRIETFRRVAIERIQQELVKLLAARRPGLGLELLERTRLLPEVLPRTEATLALEAALDASPPDLGVRLALLLGELGPAGAKDELVRLRFSRAVIERVGRLVGERSVPPDEATEADLRRILARVGRKEADALAALWRAGGPEGRGDVARRLLDVARVPGPLSAGDLALSGSDVMAILGVERGPAVGRALAHLLDVVLETPSRNTEGALREELERWWAAQGA